MSLPLISAALEKKLDTLSPSLATAYENIAFKPTPGTAYQRVNLLPNTPIDHALTADVVELRGLFQVTLCYPLGDGRGAAQLRAQAVSDHFAPVQWLTEGAIKVVIDSTARIATAFEDGDRWCLPVTVAWRVFTA